MEFFTIILEKSSSRQVLSDNFVKMLDGHRPQNMKLRQAGNGLRKLWDVEVVFDTDGSMYLDRGWKQFVRAYDLRHGYFLVFGYDGNATFAVKVFDTTMCRRRYQDDDDASMLCLFFLSISCFSEMEFFTIILEKSSSRKVLSDNFVKMLDGHRPQNMKLRQAGNGLRKLWDVEVVFDTDGSMYLDRGWKQFVRAYDLRHGYFLVFRYDGNATFAVKVFDTTMCRRRYQDNDDANMLCLFFLSIRHVLPDNFVKMLDGHRPQNMNLRQAGKGLRKLWDVEVAFDTDGSMYLDRGWKQFVRDYDLRHGYFLVFRYDDNPTFAVKVSDTTMCRRRYQDDDDVSNGSRSSEYCDRCYVYGSSDTGYRKSSSYSGYSKSSSDDGLAMVIP
ncbi:B3 domain-containing protein [Hordeum vulgare]|nr:B3 domain-containing protein [Hordeum vulgare]